VVLAFVLGLFVGWATCTGHDHGKRSNWLAWAVAAFLVGLFLAGFKWIPGLLGHLLEVALMLFAAYIIGCITGCGARTMAGGGDGHGAHGHAHDDGHGHGHAAASGHGAGASTSAAQSAAVAAPAAPSTTATAASSATGGASAETAKAPASASAALAASAASTTTEATSASAATASGAPASQPAAASASSPPASAASTTRSAGAGEAEASIAVSSEPPLTSAAASAVAPVAASDAKTSGEAAPAASHAAAIFDAPAAPRGGMTDGQRSILAAKEKLALQRSKAAAAVAVAATEAAAPVAVSLAAPPAQRATLASLGAPAPRAGMTDGQRSILAARQKMAEKAAKAAAAETTSASTPAASAPASAAANDVDGVRPPADSNPAAAADDLKLIKGIGPKNEAALNGLGVRRFAQIADWSADNEKWVGQSIRFPGRIEREHWVAQAKLLAAGVDTPHAAAVKSGAITIDDSADAPLSEDEAKAFTAALPQQAPKVADENAYAGARPLGLAAPKGGKADDLKKVKGIGRQNEERLHNLGVWHFDQIAAWTAENVKWIGSYLAFPGRIDRENWIEQAASLSRGELTEFARRVEAGDVPTSSDDRRDSKLI
ncbi:MAG: cell envelope biogenesis protein TolA, partial [Rhodoblastus sp.]|nr:cell envelope biogenesis protein TolA [Rhodoblastus sp.]